ncbi:hypothetical protein NKR19_g8021 [Coniochaeta hoffmannii]|uniref:Uncharacterized protein n=1 Tax=Coniochaeta hoffmannii TaxID=91930 RepID=A0AA38VKX6_9PEZI|nr:hypothetical protein NKR19_g8021 [Coniochaeta hoffmannii]
MPQGTIKTKVKAPPAKNHQSRKAAVAKPKSKTTAARLQKKITAGMAAKTEKLLGQRVGHLELLGHGKRGKKIEGEKKQQTGGTKKFG